MQQSRDQQLTRRLEQLQQQGQLQEARLRELLAQRDRDQPLLTELLSKMDNDSTREETLASLQQLREEQKKREAEFWGELEATMDVFMPKTKLQEMFNDHAAQIDELRRLLNQQPRGPQRRFWDENLQTFIENSDGSAASSNPTSRRGSNLMAHHPPGRGAASAASAALAASAASGATNAAPRTSTPIDVPGAAAKTSTTTTAGAAQDGTLPRRSSGSRLQVGVNATDTDSIASVDAATTLSVPDHHNDGRRSSSPASAAAFTDDGLRDDRHDVPPDAPTPPPSDEAVFGVSQLLDDLGLDASHHSQDDVAELQRMHSELQEAEQTSGQRIAAVEQELEHLKRQHQQGDESSSGGGAGAGSTGAAGGKPTQRGRSSSIGLQQQQQHQLHLLRQGEFRRISLDPRPETLLADEEWMRDPHVQRLLNIKQAEQERLADMRRRIQTKVLELRRAQHERPQDMTFGEKLAYFATANRPIHGGDEAEEQQAHGSDGGGQIHNKLREDVVLSAFGEH